MAKEEPRKTTRDNDPICQCPTLINKQGYLALAAKRNKPGISDGRLGQFGGSVVEFRRRAGVEDVELESGAAEADPFA